MFTWTSPAPCVHEKRTATDGGATTSCSVHPRWIHCVSSLKGTRNRNPPGMTTHTVAKVYIRYISRICHRLSCLLVCMIHNRSNHRYEAPQANDAAHVSTRTSRPIGSASSAPKTENSFVLSVQ